MINKIKALTARIISHIMSVLPVGANTVRHKTFLVQVTPEVTVEREFNHHHAQELNLHLGDNGFSQYNALRLIREWNTKSKRYGRSGEVYSLPNVDKSLTNA